MFENKKYHLLKCLFLLNCDILQQFNKCNKCSTKQMEFGSTLFSVCSFRNCYPPRTHQYPMKNKRKKDQKDMQISERINDQLSTHVLLSVKICNFLITKVRS